MNAVFYSVSAGAGNPELLTVQAVRVLNACEVICFPKTAGDGGESHHIAYDAVSEAVDLKTKDVRFFQIPMTRDRTVVCAEYERISRECAELVRGGNSVAFVSIGDVSLYATGSHIAERVQSLGCEVRFVAGVTSFSVAACAGAISLAQRDEMVTIIPADAFYIEKKLKSALCADGTKILMKMGRHLREIIALIGECDLFGRTVLVQKASLPDERVFRGEAIRQMREEAFDAAYLSVIIVRGNRT